MSTHEFDAGIMGCGDGLAAAFRDRIGQMSIGDRLRVRTTDPSAKEDLPSLARLMGHAIRDVEARPDGSLTITVERRR
jgi:TusA-related sulfurtransferase